MHLNYFRHFYNLLEIVSNVLFWCKFDIDMDINIVHN